MALHGILNKHLVHWEDRNTNLELFDPNNSYLINLNHIYKTTDGWATYSIVDSIVTGY